jgi:hypothetical protein
MQGEDTLYKHIYMYKHQIFVPLPHGWYEQTTTLNWLITMTNLGVNI